MDIELIMKTVEKKFYIEIFAEDGFVLTQANLENEDDRVFGKYFCLGKNDRPENYTEWSEADAEAFEAAHKKDEETEE